MIYGDIVLSIKGFQSICFVSHLAYGAMSGGKAGHIGGVELL
jgi:hypothetical protein